MHHNAIDKMIAHSENVVLQSFCLHMSCILQWMITQHSVSMPSLAQPAIDDSVADIDNLAEQRFIKQSFSECAIILLLSRNPSLNVQSFC